VKETLLTLHTLYSLLSQQKVVCIKERQ